MSSGRKGQVCVYAVAVRKIKLLVVHADNRSENFGLLVYGFSHNANWVGYRLAVLRGTDGDRRTCLAHRTGIRADTVVDCVEQHAGLHQPSQRFTAVRDQAMRTRGKTKLEIR